MATVFYPGSFDPLTNGHLNIISKASKMFDFVVIGIGVNKTKKRKIDRMVMKECIEKVLARESLINVKCVVYEGLTADEAKKHGADVLIRGIRNSMDYDLEENMALINQSLSGLDTIYLRAGLDGYISSSLVYDLLTNDKDISALVPPEVLSIKM